ncbi:MAG TPA: alpha/beta hydrolase [Gammaproteobacteria bacterium]|nr:alpha/beta hydrolase [Gammaproteobacteria bacterium]
MSRDQYRVDESLFVAIHGVEQWLVLRGDRRNPALMVVPGPGVATSAWAPFFAAWEDGYTLIHWDQPGGGATQAKNGDRGTGPLTLARLVDDGIAVADLARHRLGVPRVALLCASGGTIVGLMMTERRPDLFSAYVGSGQIVDWARQDALSYRLLLERARAANDAAMLADLERIGPPPYRDTATDAVKSKYAGAWTPAEAAAVAPLFPLVAAAMQGRPAAYLAPGLKLGDPRADATAAYDRLRPEIVAFDARRQLKRRFDVPLFFFQGADDAFTVTAEVCDYVAEIEATRKCLVILEGAGHSAFFLRDEILRLLDVHVRPVVA